MHNKEYSVGLVQACLTLTRSNVYGVRPSDWLIQALLTNESAKRHKLLDRVCVEKTRIKHPILLIDCDAVAVIVTRDN